MLDKRYLFVFVILSSIYYINCTNEVSSKRYCYTDEDCMEEQFCFVKQCTCKPRFISNGIYCFPEAKYNDQCWFDDQCLDHREACVKVVNDLMRCQCDRFHDYDFTNLHCVPKRNLTDMLIEKYDFQSVIERQATATFSYILFGGLSLAVIGGVFLTIALFYCYRMHASDTKLQKQVDKLSKKLGKTNPVVKKDIEEDLKRNEATVIPIIQDNMIIGDF